MKPFILKSLKLWETRNYRSLDLKDNAARILHIDEKFPAAKTVLILTRKEDMDIDILGTKLMESGFNYLRINSNELDNFYFSVDYSQSDPRINLRKDDESYFLDEIPVIIYRHFNTEAIENQKSTVITKYLRDQWADFPYLLEDFYNGKWINKPSSSLKSRKSYQLMISKKLGFKTLSSWLTNDPSFLKKIKVKLYGKVLKMHFIESSANRRWRIFGSKIQNGFKDDEISAAPLIYQDFFNHYYESRVIVLNGEFWAIRYENHFASDVHSQSMDLINPVVVDVPSELQKKILRLLILSLMVVIGFSWR